MNPPHFARVAGVETLDFFFLSTKKRKEKRKLQWIVQWIVVNIFDI